MASGVTKSFTAVSLIVSYLFCCAGHAVGADDIFRPGDCNSLCLCEMENYSLDSESVSNDGTTLSCSCSWEVKPHSYDLQRYSMHTTLTYDPNAANIEALFEDRSDNLGSGGDGLYGVEDNIVTGTGSIRRTTSGWALISGGAIVILHYYEGVLEIYQENFLIEIQASERCQYLTSAASKEHCEIEYMSVPADAALLAAKNLINDRIPKPWYTDSDGDGLYDMWEIDGIDINEDGVIDLPLDALGADPNHKDLFVEVDSMEGRTPQDRAIERVVEAFAAVPNKFLNNPDGADGINLHVQLDEDDIALEDWPDPWAGFDPTKAARFGTPWQRESSNWANIWAAKRLVYRYCIFANSHSGDSYSGIAELPGNDFVVSLGRWNTPGGTQDQQAGTFMHELGHTLGLRHGGSDDILYKPNYHSIMNYTWQNPNPRYSDCWKLDYSREILPTLNEADLNEATGIGGAMDCNLPVGPLPSKIVRENGPVDWNRDNDFNDVSVNADVNRIYGNLPASPNEVLVGFEDWSKLIYNFAGLPDAADGVHESDTDPNSEITYETSVELSRIGCMTGDLNCDGVVDHRDMMMLAEDWLSDDARCDIAPEGGDGIINSMDLAVVAGRWLEEAQQ